jgi:hypothetical protein
MRTLRLGLGCAVLLMATCAAAADQPKALALALDLRRAVPADAYMVVHGKHNPKRDFQREYYKAVWKTVEETKIVEQATQIVVSRLRKDQVEQAKAVLEEVKAAASPIKLAALADCKEVVYAQRMSIMSEEVKVLISHHLLLLRLTPEAAAQTQKGIKNLFGLAEKYSQGKVSVKTSTEGNATVVALGVPREVPFQPTVIRIGDVLLLSSSDEMARRSLDMLVRGAATSKFDDPRLKDALSRLPAPEDSLMFYDARLQFSQLRGMVDFLRSVGQGNPEAARIAGLMEVLFDEVSIMDYLVAVEYTEGNLNRSVAYGKTMPGAENKTLAKVLGGGEPFANWQTWVPANAVSYSLTTGANLHPLYERIIAVIKERFPEAEPGLAKFEQLQSQIGVHLDRDILQAFSGECVSVSLPAAVPSPFAGHDWVMAMRCQKPDRIRELLHRLVDKVKDHPIVAAQQLRLTKSETLEGFEELSALVLAGFGVKPVIGFRDGWMILGSNAEAVKTVLKTKAGKGPTIADTKAFKQFQLKVEGPVRSIGCTNLAEKTRQIAKFLNQAGTLAPMIIGMVGAKANPDDLKPIQEVLGLLPSLGKIVSKFDFLEANISVTQAGDQPGTYQVRTVTVVRPPAGR